MPGLTSAVHQPNFFPRLSTLAKLYAADVWVILDDVQFTRRDYQHRCYLPAAGTVLPARWLTVPVHLPAGRATLIKDARIADPDLAARHARGRLRQYFRKSPHRAAISGLLAGAEDAVASCARVAAASERTTIALLRAAGGGKGSAAAATSPPAQAGPSGSQTSPWRSARPPTCAGPAAAATWSRRRSPHEDWPSSSSRLRPGS